MNWIKDLLNLMLLLTTAYSCNELKWAHLDLSSHNWIYYCRHYTTADKSNAKSGCNLIAIPALSSCNSNIGKNCCKDGCCKAPNNDTSSGDRNIGRMLMLSNPSNCRSSGELWFIFWVLIHWCTWSGWIRYARWFRLNYIPRLWIRLKIFFGWSYKGKDMERDE